MILRFTIPGKICSNHRARVAQFRKDKYGRKIPLARPRTYRPKDYEDFRNRAQRYALAARADAGWRIPAKRVKLRMHIHFFIASRMMSKAGKTKPHLIHRPVPDRDNMEKCVTDSLQGILYLNDRDVNVYPFPGKEWVTICPGVFEWIDVELLTEERPGQIEMASIK